MLASPAALLNHRNPPLAIISFRSPKPRRGLRIRSDLRPPLLLSATSSAPSPKLSSIPDTLRVLEWHKLCDCVASFAGTSLGREATKKKLLSLDVSYEQSIHLLQETAAAVEILNSGVGGMDFGGIDTDMVKSAIDHASRGFPINGKEAIAVASIIQSVDLLQTNLKALTEDADWYHRFMPLTEPILDLPVTGTRAFINSVHQVIDEEGSVKDTASSELKHLREQLRTTETKLYYLMEKLAKPETMEGSSSEIITINGRWCLKVASDQFTKHEGLLLTSGAGSESLVEPLAAIPLNDELQRTRSLATRAEEDVLSKLTDKMLEIIDDIESLLDSTIQLDVVIARAQYSIRYGGTYPDLFLPEDKVLVGPEASSSVNRTPEAISKPQSKWKFYARGAYHPLLLQQHHEKLQMAKNDIDVAVSEFRRMRLQGHGVLSDDDIESTIAALKLRVAKMEEDHPVPVDFTISVKTRVVVVTGPNTGGKTASLKTVGLAALMAKIGLYVLASEPVQMPWFDAIYVDIGDEQSLSQSLSTFSSHLKRISAIRSNSTEQSLVLLDEVGAGTNPLEGAALGMSLLESFAESCAFLTIATTHHGELKTLKYSNNLFENACMEFDEVILQPTYRILWGVPGRSNAINIAERLGLSHTIIDTARKLYGTTNAEINEVIIDMEAFKQEFENQLQEARQIMMLARQDYENLLAVKHRISDHTLTLKTRKSQSVIDTASLACSILRSKLRDVRKSRKKQITQTQAKVVAPTSDEKESLKRKGEEGDDIAGAVDEHPPLKSTQVENVSSSDERQASNGKSNKARSKLPKEGEEVYVSSLNKKATVLKVDTSKGEVTVQANFLKLRLKFSDIGFQTLQG